MHDRRSVALIIETSNAYARGLMNGIISYQRENELWSIYVGEQERGAQPPDWLANWRGDGIIARIENNTIADAVRRLRLPTVDVSAARLMPDVPWVETDDCEIARQAARHLIGRGFRRLAFCGEPDFNWSRWREESFVAFAEQAGCEHFLFHGTSRSDKHYSWIQERHRLKTWVEQLPKPIGVMACYDFKGQQILDVCRELEVAVPEQMAVIGVDDDSRLCELCTPPLSSVIPDTHRTGYEAARLLDRLMDGEQVASNATLLPPLGIAERQSTDVYAINDPDLVTALRFIREHACEGITVADVLSVVPLSRRMLEQRFLKLVRRTPYSEISRIRMECAGRLLRETGLPMADIARRAGFADPIYLSKVFKKYMGISPRAYRNDANLASHLRERFGKDLR